MRIVMFSDAYWPRVNGVTVSVDSYSRALIKAGHEVLVICSSYPEGLDGTSSLNFDRDVEDGGPKLVRVPSIPAFVTKEDRLAKFTKWHWVFRQVESFNPEIIHINTEFVIAQIGFLYARAHNLPAIYTFHTMWEDYGPNYFPMLPPFLIKFIARSIIKTILFQSYRVIVPTTQIDEVVHNYNHRTKTFLLPTGIEPELFDHTGEESEVFRKKLEETFPKLKEKRILLFAGRIVKEKNLGFLLNILPEILMRHPDVVLLFAGSGPDLDYFKEEAKKKGLEGNCEFSGYVERKYLALIYRVSEVFLFPSLTDTQGLVTLEAMFSGTPVVAIGALGTLMVMGGDNGGFMVENDEGEFTESVLALLGDRGLWRRKSEEARIHARSWSIEELTKKLAGIYKATAGAYRDDYGESRMPVWELLMDKRWWNINNKIFKKRTSQIWQGMRSKLTS
jgi:glycosyltransferase involved in cell wall biosynthesis